MRNIKKSVIEQIGNLSKSYIVNYTISNSIYDVMNKNQIYNMLIDLSFAINDSNYEIYADIEKLLSEAGADKVLFLNDLIDDDKNNSDYFKKVQKST